ncbi:MAG: hypothetical protein H7Y88_09475 [Phycisphaerales bacterium]|nr:hypothetical protein [Phycisphaerales bacterium]
MPSPTASRATADSTSTLGFAPSPRSDDFDSLTQLFLGELDLAQQPAPAAANSIRVETGPSAGAASTSPASDPLGPPPITLLMLGNLPVLGAAWAMQHARSASSARSAPVALAHIRDGILCLDAVGPGSELILETPGDPLRAIARLIDAGAEWILRAAEGDACASVSHAVPRFILLCGGDESSLVAGYRSLRTVIESIRERGDEPDTDSIQAVVLGSPAPEALRAQNRLIDTARRFLGFELQATFGAAKVQSFRPPQCVYRGPWPAGMNELLSEIALARSAPRQFPVASIQRQTPVLSSAIEDVITDPLPRSLTRCPALLADHLPDLRPLTLACPVAPAVQFALDAARSLHILASSNSAAPGSALDQLMAASAWSERNHSLVSRAAGLLARSEHPVLHLFSTTARSLLPMRESGAHLHLLVRIDEATAARGLACVDLH